MLALPGAVGKRARGEPPHLLGGAPRLAEAAGFTARDWLEPPELVARIGEVAQSGRRGMATGVDGVTLKLVMPDFDERMAGLARNVEEQRISMVMAVLSRQ